MRRGRGRARSHEQGRSPSFFQPDDYGSNLWFWLDGGWAAKSGSNLATWTDRAGGTVYTADVGHEPTVTTSAALNGQACVQFTPAASATVTSATTKVMTGTNWSWLIVLSQTHAAPSQFDVGAAMRVDAQAANAWYLVSFDQAGFYEYTTPPTTIAPTMSGIAMQSSNTASRINGGAMSAGTWNGGATHVVSPFAGLAQAMHMIGTAGDTIQIGMIVCVNQAGGLPELGPYLLDKYGKAY